MKLLRVKHWIKNLLVVFPVVFAERVLEMDAIIQVSIAFLSFCFASSVVYVLNDIKDVEADRSHPTKKNRPIANGSVKVSSAIVVAVLLLICSFAFTICFAQDALYSFVLLLVYLLLNIGYSFGLKNIAIVDIGILAAGFLLRVLFGGTFCGISISSWLFLTVLSLAFYFALGKRRGELKEHGSSARMSLKGKNGYTASFLDNNMYVFLACGFVFYSLWTFERIGSFSAVFDLNTVLFVLAIPFAMLICMRYSLDIESEGCDGDPVTTVLRDKPLLFFIVAWMIIMLLSIYGKAI